MTTFNFEQDAAELAADHQSKITASIDQLIKSLKEHEEYAEELQEAMKKNAEVIERLKVELIPNALGPVAKMVLTDGTKVEKKPVLRAGIPTQSAIAKEADFLRKQELSDRRENAFEFLKNHEADGIIKNEFVIELGKMDADKVNQFKRKLNELIGAMKKKKHLPETVTEPIHETSVHAQTLLAWMREKFESEPEIFDKDAFDAFAIYQGIEAKVTFPKVKK